MHDEVEIQQRIEETEQFVEKYIKEDYAKYPFKREEVNWLNTIYNMFKVGDKFASWFCVGKLTAHYADVPDSSTITTLLKTHKGFRMCSGKPITWEKIEIDSFKSIKCPRCKEDNIIKSGITSLKKQQYKCLLCNKRFVLEPEESVFLPKYPETTKTIALSMHENGRSSNETCNEIKKENPDDLHKNLNRSTISRWIKEDKLQKENIVDDKKDVSIKTPKENEKKKRGRPPAPIVKGLKCPRCGEINCISLKRGIDNQYKCKSCNRCFIKKDENNKDDEEEISEKELLDVISDLYSEHYDLEYIYDYITDTFYNYRNISKTKVAKIIAKIKEKEDSKLGKEIKIEQNKPKEKNKDRRTIDKKKIECPYCKNTNVDKSGSISRTYGIARRYFCLICKKKFTIQDKTTNDEDMIFYVGKEKLDKIIKNINLNCDIYSKISKNMLDKHYNFLSGTSENTLNSIHKILKDNLNKLLKIDFYRKPDNKIIKTYYVPADQIESPFNFIKKALEHHSTNVFHISIIDIKPKWKLSDTSQERFIFEIIKKIYSNTLFIPYFEIRIEYIKQCVLFDLKYLSFTQFYNYISKLLKKNKLFRGIKNEIGVKYHISLKESDFNKCKCGKLVVNSHYCSEKCKTKAIKLQDAINSQRTGIPQEEITEEELFSMVSDYYTEYTDSEILDSIEDIFHDYKNVSKTKVAEIIAKIKEKEDNKLGKETKTPDIRVEESEKKKPSNINKKVTTIEKTIPNEIIELIIDLLDYYISPGIWYGDEKVEYIKQTIIKCEEYYKEDEVYQLLLWIIGTFVTTCGFEEYENVTFYHKLLKELIRVINREDNSER